MKKLIELLQRLDKALEKFNPNKVTRVIPLCPHCGFYCTGRSMYCTPPMEIEHE